MKRRWAVVGVLATLAITATATASVDLLTFEGLQDLEPIADYYNGGTGGFGSGPGPNYGVTFTPTDQALAVISLADGGSGDFANNPSGDTIAMFLSVASALDMPAGFAALSFYYCSPYYDATVSLYDGLDGTGNLLESVDLPATPTVPSASGSDYDNWQLVSITFNGIAESAAFSGPAVQQLFGLDNVSLTTPVGTPAATPEPAALVIWLVLGALGFGAYRCRRARRPS